MKTISKTEEAHSDIILRKMIAADYDSVIKLWKQGKIPYRPQGRDSKKNIRWQLRQQTSLYFVAETKGVIIGVILGTHDGRKGWINRLVVSPLYQKKGVAKQLVEEVENQLAVRGIDIIACLVEDWNATSMNVFERLGYTKHTDILYFSKRKNNRI
jgi:ribosomal protein S18 acetylase RimI-like enzyme